VQDDLVESAAICLHLIDTQPDCNLAPVVGNHERAIFYKWLMSFTTTLQRCSRNTCPTPGFEADDLQSTSIQKNLGRRKISPQIAQLPPSQWRRFQWGLGELRIANSLQRRKVCEKATRVLSENQKTLDMIGRLVDH